MIENMIVPGARTHRRITAGCWVRSLEGDILSAVQLYETKPNARETVDQIQSGGPSPGAPVSLVSVNIYEVIARV